MDQRKLIALLPALALLAAPAVAHGATMVGVQPLQGGGNVVLADDDDSAGEIDRRFRRMPRLNATLETQTTIGGQTTVASLPLKLER